MNRLIPIIVSVMIATAVQADDKPYRAYRCGDFSLFDTTDDYYVHIKVVGKPYDEEKRRDARVTISDHTYTGIAYQYGLDYRIDFGSPATEDGYDFSIAISNNGTALFYDFTMDKDDEGVFPSQFLECKLTGNTPRPAVSEKDVEAEHQYQEDIRLPREENERLRREMEGAERLATVGSGELAVYMAQIRQKIERNWSAPASAGAELECSVRIRQVPGGEVAGVTILSCNGNEAVRRSVEAAIYRSSPLPEPSDPSLFDRNILLKLSIRQ